MHYYKKNIGDYHKKAGRLSMLEHGAYTLLLDACYDRERFPTEDEAIEWAWARTDEEKVAVRFVLRRFFSLRDGVYVQERIEEEIARYHENASTNARIAREREEKRKAIARTVHEPSPEQHEAPPNHKPITNNQEPVLKTQRKKRADDFDDLGRLIALGITEAVARDFIAIRKKKHAPLTETAIIGMQREAEKAGVTLQDALVKCCSRGWQGFEASWLTEVAGDGISYTSDALAVIESYNTALGASGWPEAVVFPYSPGRAAAIAEFIGFNNKSDCGVAYFSWLAANLPAKPGYGFDWAIKRETYLRAREGNFTALAA